MTEQSYTYRGRELPVWSCPHWQDVEDFIESLCPKSYVLTIEYELLPKITGIVFSRDPLVASNAVAAYVITDPEPEP